MSFLPSACSLATSTVCMKCVVLLKFNPGHANICSNELWVAIGAPALKGLSNDARFVYSLKVCNMGNSCYNCSSFIQVCKLRGTKAAHIIQFLNEQFSRHGITDVLVTDKRATVYLQRIHRICQRRRFQACDVIKRTCAIQRVEFA